MIPPEGTSPVSDGPAPTPDAPETPETPDSPTGRPGSGTFTIEGRSAPALFVIGWLATLVGLGAIFVGVLSGGSGVAPFIAAAGLLLLAVGLIAGAGSQAIERRARGRAVYQGPSPFLVFAASIPVSLLIVVLIGVPMSLVGLDVQSPIGSLLAVSAQGLVYWALIRLLVVDAGALDWAGMGWRRFDTSALTELAGGALWAVPVIVATIPVALVLSAIFPVQPVSPLPPAGEPVGFALNLIAGAIVAPIGEELLFRGFATTAWAKDLGRRRALIQGALFFAVVHVLTIGGATVSEAFGLAVLGFATRVPVALALGWLFLRRGSIWAPIGLHAAFNGILLVLGEAALRSGAA